MLKPDNLRDLNIEALKSNDYQIDDCISFANKEFDDIIILIQKKSTGYKIALKKLADEVLYLRKQLKDDQSCKTKQEKAFFTDASSQDSLALV
jgi:hypothetical protein